jgi:ATP-dependent DNA ligase
MLSTLRIRCPDTPWRIARDTLPEFDADNNCIATVKYDGWRCIIDWDGQDVGFFSRRTPDKGGPTILPVCESLKSEVLEWLQDNQVPPLTRFDSEWIARRTEGPERIRIFGIQYYDGKWIGRDSEDVRFTLIETMRYNQPHVLLVEYARENYTEFFKAIEQKYGSLPEKQQRAEGIVLKHVNSKLLGNIKVGKKNPQWYKIKWRDGASGHAPTF